jgi:uncharacterized damage-inducible protein DinB
MTETTLTHLITQLIHYNFWADEHILNACGGLPEADFTRPIDPDPGWGSLRGILAHALDAEMGWRAVLEGRNAAFELTAADFPDVGSLRERWAAERDAWLAYAAGLSDEQLNQSIGPNHDPEMSAWQVIIHVVNHGTQHRAEAAAFLTGLGRSPGELDFDVYLFESGE